MYYAIGRVNQLRKKPRLHLKIVENTLFHQATLGKASLNLKFMENSDRPLNAI